MLDSQSKDFPLLEQIDGEMPNIGSEICESEEPVSVKG